MMRYLLRISTLIAMLTSTFLVPSIGLAEGSDDGLEPLVVFPSRTDTSMNLRDIPTNPPDMQGRVLPRKMLPNRVGSQGPAGPDPVQQESTGPAAPANGANFEGINNVDGVLPPDTVGEVGPNHYVQMVNLSFAIWDRSGSLLYGPASSNTLWSGFGGPCESTNDGDPVVLYDHLADRWMMSQFALPSFPIGPFYECIAVSQTGDPTGAWYRYEYRMGNKMNDYPKFGVWPDGYYMTMNQFNQGSLSWGGQGVAVFDRTKMLNGQSAKMVYFDLYKMDPNLGGMLPADLDGPAPPAGTPNYFSQFDDDAWGYSPDQLQIWQFHTDWSNPRNATFTHVVDLPTAAFDSNLCGYDRNCIPQPGGTNVDAISDRLMYRLQYRDFGDHQSIVLNHSVNVGSDRAGVRWYELRNSGGGWNIHQQGTYAPSDGDSRWMASIAMNALGDIGLGFSVSGSSTFPSIRYTGRLDGDPLGQMTQGEGTIIAGSGYQTHSAGRWGDYSTLSVDPTDDCTFWYTQEYYATVGSAPWQTRVGAFTLRDCGGGPVDNPPSVNITNPGDGATVSGTVTVTADASDDNGVTKVEFFVDGNSLGVDSNGGDGWSASWDTTTASNGAHTVSATATDTIGQTGTDSVGVTVDNGGPVDNPPNVNITNPAAGATVSGAVTVTADASDDNGVTQVEFFVDGTSLGVDSNGGDGWSASWDTTTTTDGAHIVSATATDTIGQTGSDSIGVSVNNGGPGGTTLHIGDLDGSGQDSGRKWDAEVTITVHDADHNPVANATVYGVFPGGRGAPTVSCTTDGSGVCTVSKTNINGNSASVTFTVEDVTHASLAYDAAANHDPDGDSDGTVIVVNKP